MQGRAVLGEGWVGQPHMRVEVALRRQAGSLRHVALAASQLHACGREGLLDLAAAQAEVPPPQGPRHLTARRCPAGDQQRLCQGLIHPVSGA